MIDLAIAAVILAQAVYWLFWKEDTEHVAQETWDACLYPGRKK